MNINIAIIGCVSAGKSTLLNAIFARTFSDMKIKRTTMVPQIYEYSKMIKDINDDNLIRIKNRSINESFNHKLKTQIHNVPMLYDFNINLPTGINIRIHDMPGINDSQTKEIYIDYFENTYGIYDIIIFVIDINSSLNTSDEIDILTMCKNCIQQNKNKGIKTELMVLLNKCDIIDGSYGEKKELVDQVKKILNDNGINQEIITLSAEDSFVYRTIQRDISYKLDMKYIDKFCYDMKGKKFVRNSTESQKKLIIKKLIESKNISEDIELSGFNNFKRKLEYLLKNNLFDFIFNKYIDKLNDLTKSDNQNINNFNIFNQYYKELTKLHLDKYNIAQQMIPILEKIYLNWKKTVYGLNKKNKTRFNAFSLNEQYNELCSNINCLKKIKLDFTNITWDYDNNFIKNVCDDLEKIKGFTQSILLNNINRSSTKDTFIIFERLKFLQYPIPALIKLIKKEMDQEKFILLEPKILIDYIIICERDYEWDNNYIFEYIYQTLLYNYKKAYTGYNSFLKFIQNKASYIYFVENLFLKNFRNSLDENDNNLDKNSITYKCENLKFWIRKLRIVEYVDNINDLEYYEILLEKMICKYYKKITEKTN